VFTLAAGGRQFIYKPETMPAHEFDWVGPTASTRLDLVLWQSPDGTRSVDLVTTLGFEARAYETHALANGNPPGMPPAPAPTDLLRRDRVQRAGLELTWLGGQVIGAGYQLTVVDSNTFGQSLVRHKLTASATASLPWRLFGSALATVELAQYLDGLPVQDVNQRDFTTLDDENFSSLQFRLARALTQTWSLETRVAAWRDLGGVRDTEYKRSLIYVGVIYAN
jgi:hypothetical protein